ncbi:alpha/beta hydrolase [Conexibacter sp. SYSU D00693]|uniref:PHA/PHB synthase family protein n=1 Tax=Conexibacter sp. SYSU D00693 TaxID=2812560 RepID=UPI00196B326F|nr:alpha/beta fold hydrolase [Conexibacter sp. SYSU D00693]
MSESENGTRPARAALDVLLTDAAVGNPAMRAARQPLFAARAVAKVAARPDRLARRGAGFAAELGRIARGSSEVAPRRADRRFADPAWEKNWFFRRLLQSYLAAGAAASQVVEDARLDWQTETAARFVVENAHDLLAPTNFPWSNPAVLKETLDQGGANLVVGLRRAGRDAMARRLPAMVDTSRFEVGGNLATTKGSVVLRTEVFELLQYTPVTDTVHEVPLVVVPPTINKYYVLDLAPGRSMVEHLVGEGHQVFMVSWRNPGQEQGHFDFDTYASAILEARDAVAKITKQAKVNLMAACSGGLLTAGLLGHLARDGALHDQVNSLTLLVCALDNARAGTVSALARREVAAVAVAESARRGYVEGKALNNVFAWLRPNDLVWGYVVNNYLMGKAPPAFDILYWNQDAVRLAAGLHHDFVRIALDNTLVEAEATEVLGTPIDLGEVDLDVYAVAGINDHIVPWENAYRGARVFGGTTRFVLSTSGHIQALINPPGPKSKSSYRVSEELPEDHEQYLHDIPTVSGSWWPDHVGWLSARAGERKPAPKRLGGAGFKPTAAAPGSYVHAA